MSRAIVIFATLALLFACGCSAEEGMPIATWRLVTSDGAEKEIVLPAHPRVPRDRPFTLRAHVERPATLRVAEGTLSISHLYAPVTLRESGRELPATMGVPDDGAYRDSGVHAWRIPPGDRDLDLELVVDHRWMGSRYLDAVPRLTNGTGARASARVPSLRDRSRDDACSRDPPAARPRLPRPLPRRSKAP